MLVVSGEQAFRMEQQDRFDYANPQYIFNVLMAVVACAVGGGSLIRLNQIAEMEKQGG